MDNRIYINNDWKFSNEFKEEMKSLDFDDSSMETVRLPHCNKKLPYNYADENKYQFVSWYRKKFSAPKEWQGRSVILTFEGIAHSAQVYINGIKAAVHNCGYTAFSVDIADYLDLGNENIITVSVDSRENLNVPPFGNVIDYMTYGGIYREAYIEVKENIYIEDIFVKTYHVEETKKSVHLHITLNKQESCSAKIEISRKDNGQVIFTKDTKLSSEKSKKKYYIENTENWDIDNPVLYRVTIKLYHHDEVIDEKTVTFGFKQCEFRKDGFYLNGRKIKIMGLNRHQSYPYVGYAMPKRAQENDADILKYELGVNAVRTSHYPQSQYFLDRCDEIGLLVFTEMPGWQHIGNSKWKEQACENIKEMVMQYRNHPSIILWGVRINESKDDDEFYNKTNKICHMLDNTRQTGGVRCIKKSTLLEDVYTYNDFVHNGTNKGAEDKKNVTSEINKPYLISEFNGHMYPTKMFDDEKHRTEHALRHTRVLNDIFGADEITGGFGWCMFDYNTHQDFGSGDRICYHGVMDMFRNPKLASYVYASQSDAKPVFEISSSMDIGEHAGCNLHEVYAFTNADSVKLYKNGEFIKEFFSKDSPYSNMIHPPILINDFIGDRIEKNEGYSKRASQYIKEILKAALVYGQDHMPVKYLLKGLFVLMTTKMKMEDFNTIYDKYVSDWGGTATTYRFEAIKDNKVVKTIIRKPAANPKIIADSDTYVLEEGNTYDVASIRIKAVDEDNNILPYFNEPVSLKSEGPIEIIGPSVISLKGGCFGTYIKTTGSKGQASLTISSEGLEEVNLIFNIK